ncbi:unnamed protein product [Protopolystoma xenopodis]|uniref:Uncharacterized protein n=1 Tax=Protopolystoma xenopodis TaxID=117903 RepID=A0A448XI56_9PLAT|nr:unnamed protein product [Protopolystoma xenopodis]
MKPIHISRWFPHFPCTWGVDSNLPFYSVIRSIKALTEFPSGPLEPISYLSGSMICLYHYQHIHATRGVISCTLHQAFASTHTSAELSRPLKSGL